MSTSKDEVSLEDLVKTFHSQVSNSDWLKANTVEQWEKDNPELAKDYKAALDAKQNVLKKDDKEMTKESK